MNDADAQVWSDRLPKADQHYLTTIDLIVDRRQLTSRLVFQMKRIALYHMNYELMSEIDIEETLRDEIIECTRAEYDAAKVVLENKHPNALPLLEKLSHEGLDYFWSNGDEDLTINPTITPWIDYFERDL